MQFAIAGFIHAIWNIFKNPFIDKDIPEEDIDDSSNPPCPKCGRKRIKKIGDFIYFLPDSALEKKEPEKYVLDLPVYHCSHCENEFFEEDKIAEKGSFLYKEARAS
jgi:DNA-directed RNA polymerase subunit RPC12/RpoP